MHQSVYSGIIPLAFNIILRNVGGAQVDTECCVSALTQMGDKQPSHNRLLYYVSHCEIPFHELSELSVERVFGGSQQYNVL
ncbi:hypothetical protein [Halopseudomonas pelagia]|uniref:Uncharacterized protein n=1 Tax=Halopseudomonas pelagia TaxID=553151 RepID=A0AA91U153_9GAMM|nr:hypothetical protein [Halopseudomonas pelagia]PCC98563.1 hypothetical protein CO192_15025 [Halopseudomonas pelagia]QFY57719.1 hypothetical protein EAO82_15910 [Halopseudomonas pelagia]